jgi:hypothetical protein
MKSKFNIYNTYLIKNFQYFYVKSIINITIQEYVRQHRSKVLDFAIIYPTEPKL